MSEDINKSGEFNCAIIGEKSTGVYNPVQIDYHAGKTAIVNWYILPYHTLIRFNNVTKTYKKSLKPAVDSLTLEIPNGSIIGFVGLNGAGKTTSIKIAAGINKATSGDVLIDDCSITVDRNKAIKEIGWVSEFPTFDAGMKAEDMFNYYCGLCGFSSNERKRRTLELLEKFGLSNDSRKRLTQFSHGMKKRFMIAVALITEPKNLLFDETLTGLDPEGIKYVRDFIKSSKRDGRSVFISSHVLSELEGIADKYAIIHGGKLLKILDKRELSEKGKGILHLNIPNYNEDTIAILEEYGEVSQESSSFTMKNLLTRDKANNKILDSLRSKGYDVAEYRYANETLEEFFLKLIEEG